jgi:transposase
MTNIKGKTVSPYKNKTIYVGIDTHKNTWSVTIRIDGMHIKTLPLNPKPLILKKYLNDNFPEASYKCVYEAGFGGFWIHWELKDLGIECLVVHVSDIPTTDKDKSRKNDSNDSRKLALELERGSLTSIYIPTEEHQHFRGLCRAHDQTVKDTTCTKNRIKGIINLYGLTFNEKTDWSKKFIAELKGLKVAPELKKLIHFQLKELDHRIGIKKEILKDIESLAKKNNPELLKRIKSISGIGIKSAVTFIGEIWDMKRFDTLDKLKCYVGLIPSTHSSGESIKEGQLTNRRNKVLRRILIECAWVAMKTDKALTDCYFKLSARMKPQQAIIRIAKKLLSRLRAIWLGEQMYAKGVYE